MTSFVALLRGINVGGSNLIRMPDLQAAFRDAGHGDVRTYLQSGNVLFTAEQPDGPQLEDTIERMLEERFGMSVLVVLRSRSELAATVAAAPEDHGSARLRSDVIFLKRPLTAEAALAQFPELRAGVDSVSPGPGAIFFSRVAAQATRTRLNRLMSLPVFGQMTMRSWRTTTRLLDLTPD